MSLTQEQIVERRERMGSSDMAAVLGVPSFANQSAWTVWAEKCGMLEPEQTRDDAIEAGNLLEPVVLDYAERTLGKMDRQVLALDPQGSRLGSLLDGLLLARKEPVEGKTSGVVGPIHGHWGEPGSDDFPENYIVQTQVHLACQPADVCHLVVLLGARGFVHYQTEPQDDLISTMRDVAADFFDGWVIPRRDPRDGWAERLAAHGVTVEGDPCAPTMNVVRRLRRVPDKSIELPDPERFLEWQRLRQTRLDAAKAEDAAEAALLADMGDAQAGLLPGGSYIERCVERGAFQYDRAAMEADGVFEKYATQGTRRVLRVRKAKGR